MPKYLSNDDPDMPSWGCGFGATPDDRAETRKRILREGRAARESLDLEGMLYDRVEQLKEITERLESAEKVSFSESLQMLKWLRLARAWCEEHRAKPSDWTAADAAGADGKDYP